MAGKMTMTGAGEVPLMKQSSVRRIEFPDGVDRLISLQNFYWAAFDRILEDGHIPRADFIGLIWTHAIQTPELQDGKNVTGHPEFEAQIPRSIRATLTVWRNDIEAAERGMANENDF